MTNLYPFRPHTEHLLYLDLLLRSGGLSTSFLVADCEVASSYPRILRKSSFIKEYIRSYLGGVRTYPCSALSTPKTLANTITDSLSSDDDFYHMTLSSACTLTRIESDDEMLDDSVKDIQKALIKPTKRVYEATLAWIEQEKLDSVIVFNGRLELTRAVIEACNKKNIPFVTHERSWFGDGIQLIPNDNCLSLTQANQLVSDYSMKPLKTCQAKKASQIIAKRFLRKNDFEWRVYNKLANKTSWPTKTKLNKVLILPSSRAEFLGEVSYRTDWDNNTQAIDELFEFLGIVAEQVVVRFHPAWSENIGNITGDKARNLYKSWCSRKGYFYIDSNDPADSYDLINSSDIVILNGSSVAIEAGVLGKKIICLSKAPYQCAGFVYFLDSREKILNFKGFDDISHMEMIKRVLRFVYTYYARFPQFVDYVRLVKTIDYDFFEGGDSERLIKIIKTGELFADDDSYSSTQDEENIIANLIKEAKWNDLIELRNNNKKLSKINFRHRLRYFWVSIFSKRLPKGDLG